MNRLIILLLTISCVRVHGQEISKHNPPGDYHKILIGINVSPDYCFRTLKNSFSSSPNDILIRNRNAIEIARFGYTAGVNICINISKQIGMETGVQYSSKGYQTKKQALIWEQPSPNLPTKLKLVYDYRYLDIPLKLNYSTGKGKLRFLSSAGFVTNILISETRKSIQEYSNGKTEKGNKSTTSDFNKINLSPMISLGADYKINHKMSLRAEPTFRYGMVKVIEDPTAEYLWNAGLNIGLYYALK